MLDVILLTAAPVLSMILLGLAGFWVISRKLVAASALGAISPLALEVALPALVFAQIATRFDPYANPDRLLLPLWWLGFTAVSLGLALALPWLLRAGSPREFRMSLFIQNGIFLPVVYLTDIYGKESPYLLDLFFFTVLYPAMSFNVFGLFYGQKWSGDLKKLLHPVTLATLAAVGGATLGLGPYIPDFVLSAMQLMGATSVPLVMIAVGGALTLDYQQHGAKFRWNELAKFVLAKNILYPAAFLGLVALTQPPETAALMILLQAAVPPLTALPIFAERAGGDRALTSQFLLVSFVAAILTLPVTMLTYQRWIAP